MDTDDNVHTTLLHWLTLQDILLWAPETCHVSLTCTRHFVDFICGPHHLQTWMPHTTKYVAPITITMSHDTYTWLFHIDRLHDTRSFGSQNILCDAPPPFVAKSKIIEYGAKNNTTNARWWQHECQMTHTSFLGTLIYFTISSQYTLSSTCLVLMRLTHCHKTTLFVSIISC